MAVTAGGHQTWTSYISAPLVLHTKFAIVRGPTFVSRGVVGRVLRRWLTQWCHRQRWRDRVEGINHFQRQNRVPCARLVRRHGLAIVEICEIADGNQTQSCHSCEWLCLVISSSPQVATMHCQSTHWLCTHRNPSLVFVMCTSCGDGGDTALIMHAQQWCVGAMMT